MKTISKSLVIAGILLLLIAVFCLQDSLADLGDAEDPLVTKSYVQEQINQALAYSQQNGTNETVAWQIMEISPNTKVTVQAGTEIIMRAGEARIVDSTGSGVPDLTSGTNLTKEQKLPLNHLLLYPRSDQRGFRVVGYKSAIVMYKGSISNR